MSLPPSGDAVPLSPRQLLRSSLALTNAISGFMAFSSISAASFDALTGPSIRSQPASRPSATAITAPVRSRYNTRSTSRLADKENDAAKSPVEKDPVSSVRPRHALPEVAIRCMHNGRILRERRSGEFRPADSVAALPSIDLGAPSLSSTPSRGRPASDLRRNCLQTNAQRNLNERGGTGYNFNGLDEPVNVEAVFSRFSAGGSENNGVGNDSTIVLDDTPEDDNVFRFVATPKKNSGTADDTNNDSVIILTSPDRSQPEENDEELLEKSVNLDDSVRVTRHKVKRVCPITKKPFTDPMVNTRCKHVYDRPAIWAMYNARRVNGKLCRCPVAGCDQNVWLFDLKRA